MTDSGSVKFFIGLHHPSTAWPFLQSMINVNSIRGRKSDFRVNEWILDSGAFSEISEHGRWRNEPELYAEEINRWSRCGQLVAAVTQDMMCEPFIVARTGLSVERHQEITIERYLKIAGGTNQYVMPVLQGFEPPDYARHVQMWGSLLGFGQWVGVGSVCKRNTTPAAVEDVLLAIKSVRADLKLHGFGIKTTALEDDQVRSLLVSCDSMAWSLAARNEDEDGNDPRDALRYCARVQRIIGEPLFVQPQLLQWWA